MKKFIFSFFFLILLSPVFAQVNNFNYFKLTVLNDKGEVLLVNFEDTWEPAGRKYDSPESMQVVLREMAKEMGIEIEELRLRGLVNHYYGENKYPVIFNYVTAQYKSGDLAVPPGCKDIKWFKPKDALKIIPFQGIAMVLEKIFEDKDALWAGSIHIVQVPNSTRKTATVKEPFYKY